jgi:hypothetical protein
MGYRIGSFNMLRFGRASNKDFDAISQIIYEAQFDVIALQEIFSQGMGITYNLMPYLKMIPGDWVCMTSDPVDNSMESYSFIWNKQRLDLVKTEVNGQTRIAKPHIWKQYRREFMPYMKSLKRDPYYIRLTNKGTERGFGPHFELRLINTHIRSQKDDEKDISTGKQRKEELEALIKGIYPSISDKRYGNYMPAVTILLGDYNLSIGAGDNKGPFLENSIPFFDSGKKWEVDTLQSKKTTIKHKNDIESSPNEDVAADGFANNFDHFSYDKNQISAYVRQYDRIDMLTSKKLYGGSFDEYLKKYLIMFL